MVCFSCALTAGSVTVTIALNIVVAGLLSTTTSANSAFPLASLSTAETPFVEENGILVMELESVPMVDPWVYEADVTGFSGSGYARMTGNELKGGDPNGRLSYFFQIVHPGKYRFALHSYKNSHVREDWSNDCYTRVVGQPGYRGKNTKLYLGGLAFQWGWASKHEVGHDKHVATYIFDEPGVYELQLYGRSKNYIIDRVVLYNIKTVEKEFAWDITLPESPRIDLHAHALTHNPTVSPMVVPEDPKIKLTLMTANGVEGTHLMKIREGTEIDLNTLPTRLLSIRAAANVVPIDRFRFWFNGRSRTALDAPYALRGMEGDDFDGDFYKPVSNLALPGDKSIHVEALDQNGNVVVSTSIEFSVSDSGAANLGGPTVSDFNGPLPSNLQEKQITGFILFNADTNDMIGSLQTGSNISLKETGHALNLIANTVQMQGIVVCFRFDNADVREEGIAPFALGGDRMGNFRAFQPLATPGLHTVTAEAYRVEPNGAPILVGTHSIAITTTA